MIIEFPTKNIKYFSDGTVYIKADDATVDKYCEENNYKLNSYQSETQRFSNDGGLAYQFYGPFTGSTIMWQTEFGFDRIVAVLDVDKI